METIDYYFIGLGGLLITGYIVAGILFLINLS